MDKLKAKTRSARNRLASATSSGNSQGPLRAPHSSRAPRDNSSTQAVNEGVLGPVPRSAARDSASPEDQPGQQPVTEPPTSLQSSVDAGKHAPPPPSKPVATSSRFARSRSGSVPTRSASQPQRTHIPGREATIGIRRTPSLNTLRHSNPPDASIHRLSAPLPALDEDFAFEQLPIHSSTSSSEKAEPSRLRRVKSAVQARVPFWGSRKEKDKVPDGDAAAAQHPEDQPMDYTSDMVDVLDTVDPEVATLTSLTNVQNSLFIPNLPFFNRRPTYNLKRRPSETESLEEINRILGPVLAEQEAGHQLRRTLSQGTTTTLATIDSNLSESRYAVLPPGTSLEGWTKQDKAEVNDHVRHMLHSKRSRFKRAMRGFGQYVRRPLGFLVTLYATLITLFGLAWVLFLIGWINVGGKQLYVIHIIDSILVALFAIVGDGLAPFRAIDTYHMIYIAHYHHYTWSRRKKDMLPKLHDHNDLPKDNAPFGKPRETIPSDPEKQWEFTVLTPRQQARLEHHQDKFCKSHSFYKPHETETHYAFPLRLLVAIVVLLDCHSLLQISLGACTWGISYKVRPFALTTVILCCSIVCNATAGLLIWVGDKRTRKKDVLERMNRQELTQEAIRQVKEKKKKEDGGSDGEDESANSASASSSGKGQEPRSGSRIGGSMDIARKFQVKGEKKKDKKEKQSTFLEQR